MVEDGWSDAQVDCRRVVEENSHPMWVSEAQLGLVGMRERAHLVGGSMTICSSVPLPGPGAVAS